MYPGGQGRYSAMSGIGLLRLHSTYRHDLKIYASDEGRVQMTAAAFAKVSSSNKQLRTCASIYKLIKYFVTKRDLMGYYMYEKD